jgi:hypothetical protein
MGEIINLRLARKARNRTLKDKAAEANRLKFGQGKSDRLMAEKLADQAARKLDGHKRTPDPVDE